MKELLDKINKEEILLEVVDGKLKLFTNDREINSELLNEIKVKKNEIIQYLLSNESLKAGRDYLIKKIVAGKSYPISNAQRRLWILSQFEGGSVVYNIPGSTYLNQDMDIEYFKRAIDSTIERHEILRTVFKEDETGEIRQWVLKKEELGFKIDYRDFRKEKAKEEKIKNCIREDSNKAFDLENGPLLRASLIRVEDKEYVFYYNMHHIISDGWSMEVLRKDVFLYYKAYKENRKPELKELRVHYKDYSAWQLAQLEEESFKAHRAYWLNSLGGKLPLLDLPTTKQRPRIKTHNGHGLSTYIDRVTTGKLKKYSEAQGGSLYMGLLAAWNILMYRYTSQKDIIIGTPIAGREHADLEDQIGFYVNTLALRNELNPEENFDAFYRRLKDITLKSYSHQMYPFDRLVEELNLARDTSRSAIFDVMLVLQNNGEKAEGSQLKEEELNRIIDQGYSTSKFDISITFQEVGDYLALHVVYNPDVYEMKMVEGLINHYRQLINALLKYPEEKISQIDYLSPEEKYELLYTFNDTEVSYPKEKTIVDLFEAQVEKTPKNIALVFEETQLTYKELNERSNQLADYLRKSYNIKADDLIGIKLERSELMIISILGVLKSGGAYVPIDPDYPQERVDYMLEDSNCKVLIDDTELNKFKEEENKYSKKNPVSKNKASDLAYVIYTSGSTGKPKGVMIEHVSIVNLIICQCLKFKINDKENILQFSNMSFDASVEQIFIAFTRGARLSLIDKEVMLDSYKLEKFIDENKITHIHMIPSMLKMLSIKKYPYLYRVVSGGDKFPYELAKEWNKYHEFYNEYGPTETTVTSIELRYKKFDEIETTLPIGVPISNTQIFILGKTHQLQPIGVVGEICISGDGLARGYLNKPELTAEKFVDNPFRKDARMYKTGDLGRWLPDGNIEFIGRKDDQVKIRGYRIELGEIENALQEHSSIESAVVLAKTDEKGDKYLVGYVVSKEDLNASELRGYLKGKLPDYMVPGHYVQLEKLPLTPNGKVDKKALPNPEGLGMQTGVEYVAPRNEIETQLVKIYQEVLKKQPIGIKEDFFVLGGDSIKSIQIVSRLRQRGYLLSIRDILLYPKIENLTGHVQVVNRLIEQTSVEGLIPLSPIQHWFFENTLVDEHHYNQSVLLQSKASLSEEGLKQVLDKIVLHHDALRLVYKQSSTGWIQENKDKEQGFSLEIIEGADGVTLNAHCERIQSGMNLAQGPLFKVALFQGTQGDRLLLVAHHLIIDGVSWRILFEDLSNLYQQYQSGVSLHLPLKTDSFKYWQENQMAYANSIALRKEEAYWSGIESVRVEPLPIDTPAGSNLVKDAVTKSFLLDKETTDRLLTRCYRSYRTDTNDILLTAFSIALVEVFKSDKVLINLEGHGREQIGSEVDVSRTIGWFTTMYPIVFDMSYSKNSIRQLIEVKENLHRIPNKGIGYGVLRYLSGKEYQLSPEIVFNYLGDFGSGTETEGGKQLFEFSGEYHGREHSLNRQRDALLDVSGMVVDGKMRLSITYSDKQYSESTIERLLGYYQQKLVGLIEKLSQEERVHLSPVDLTYKGLSIDQLETLNTASDIEDVYPLNPLQEGIYYHWFTSPGSSVYFEQMSYQLKGALDIGILEKSYQSLVLRHGVLRTSFTQDYGEKVLQVVKKEVDSTFIYKDILEDTNFSIEDYKASDRAKGFDLHKGSQMRLTVLSLGDNRHEFIWSFHHILMDGWCVGVLIKEFFQIYHSLLQGQVPELGKVYGYSTYIKWLEQTDKEGSLKYWENYLSGYDTISTLPKLLKTVKQGYQHGEKVFSIEGSVREGIKRLCSELGVTENTFIQTVWGILLSKYNNTNDVIFGSVVSGRPAEVEGIEEMIGLFINTIPVRIQTTENTIITELLKEVQQGSIASTDHHYTQLAEIQSKSELGQGLLDHILVFENYPVQEMVEKGMETQNNKEELSILSSEVFEQTNYDFTFVVVPRVHIEFRFNYNGNIYNNSQITHLGNHLIKIIEQVVEHPNSSLKEIDYLSSAEKQKLVEVFNNTKVDYPREKTIVDLFEEQVKKTPNNIALVFEEKELSYKELNAKSNQLADYLRKSYKIKADDLIGIKLERSELMIISILGVLKSGGAYVPIDPEYPQNRVDYMVEDSKCRLVIDQEELAKFKKEEKDFSKKNLKSINKPSDLAYVIYTSGSTGKPKGCMLEHQGVINRIDWMWRHYGYNSSDIILQKTTYTFDVSVWELFMPLCWGAKMVLCHKEDIVSPERILSLIEKQKVTCLHFVPSMLHAFIITIFEEAKNIRSLNSLRSVITSGEALGVNTVNSWYDKMEVPIHDLYGPTEASIDVTYYTTKKGDINIPIGRPISNTQIYILGKKHQLCPIGVVGEICISGDGLARGYLNKPELTAEKFVDNPFRKDARMYKTGDLGRWLPDGNIEFIGRKDDQVKIRGYRIELGEIENALQEHSSIESAVVLAKTDDKGDKSLVAYVVSTRDLNTTNLRDYLSRIIPSYMVPGHYVQLEKLPLTPNGKVDKKALPNPEGLGTQTGVEYVAPRNEIEKHLVETYQEVLKKNPIGIHEDFFMLGGDSIKSIQIVSRLRQRGYLLSIRDILLYPKIGDLASHVKTISRISSQDPVSGAVILGPVQKWFFEQSGSEVNHFNQSVLLYHQQGIEEFALRACLKKLVLHHDSLRMIYKKDEASWHQENQGIEYDCELNVLSYKNEESFTKVCDALQSGFDITSGPLIKASLFKDQKGDRLLLIAHHLVIDGVSWRILLEDLSTLYEQAIKEVGLRLPLKTDSFQYWQQQQEIYSKSEVLEQESAYWDAVEKSYVTPLSLDHPEGSNLMQDTSMVDFVLDETITEALLTRCHKAYHTDINDVLLTGLSLALQKVFAIENVLIKMEGHGREHIGSDVDVSRTIGWFTTMYPVVLSTSFTDPLRQLIEVKETLHRVPNKGIGYGVLRYLSNRSYNKKADIVFNYLGNFGVGAETEKVENVFGFSSEYHGRESSSMRKREESLDVSGMVAEGKMRIGVSYSKEQYKSETMRKLITSYEDELKQLIEVLSKREGVYLSPVDLTYKGLSIDQLETLNTASDIEDVYPLNPLQEGIYYHWFTSPGSSVYFEQMSYQLKGALDIGILEKSYQSLVLRHGVLRTSFTQDYGEKVLQVVKKEVDSTFIYKDILEDTNFSIEDYKASDRAKGFDLHKGSQMRLTVLSLGDNRHEFIWSFHHILMDGWCVGVLIKEFFQIYHSLLQGQVPELGKVYGYSTYIKWLEQTDKEGSLKYWENYLSGYDTISTLPKLLKTVKQGYQHGEKVFSIEGSVREGIKRLCSELGVTENTFIQTVWGILLSKYNNTNDVIFGSVVSGRPAEVEGIEEMIGLFINTIPVRIQTTENTIITELLKEVQQGSIASTDHHYTQLAEIQSKSELGQGLLDHILVFENYPVQEMVEKGMETQNNKEELSILSSEVFEQTNYDFTFVVVPRVHIEFRFNYNGNIYNNSQITHLGNHLIKIIEQVVEHPNSSLKEIDYLSSAEKQKLVEVFNNTKVDYPREKTIVDLFEEQVKKTPNNIALVFEEKELSYKELNAKSNQLADYLRKSYKIKADDLIGIKLERSELMIISILGVLKSGGAYVPIDPEYPQERVDYMVSDSNCRLVIDEEELTKFKKAEKDYSKKNLKSINGPGDLAYVIYTSGSTGQPKGVTIEHKSVVNYLYGIQTKLNLCSDFLFISNICFDASIKQIFLPIITGKKIHVYYLFNKIDLLSNYINKHKIEILNSTPSIINGLIDLNINSDLLTSLKWIIIGGEAFDKILLDKIRVKISSALLINAYGPTETCANSTIHKFTEDTSILIGKPISNTQVYILGKENQLLPMGVIGEICIGGDGLARGYLNKPELTAEKFVDNPFKEGERMYKTGDLGRWLPDGNIEFIGRKDDQVKIRGYRIELGEIENALQGHKSIESAVVLAKTDDKGDKDLVAYIVSTEELNASDLRDYLSRIIPSYMVPGHYIQLEKLPLTPNGKVDKKSLPSPERLGMRTGIGYVAPRNEIEERLVAIWQEVLGKEKIGIKDNFFELGGHSLKMTRLMSRIHKDLEVKLELKDLFEKAILEEQAELILKAKKTAYVTIPAAPIQRSYALSSSQRRLWVLSQFEQGNIAYNIPGVYEFEGDLDRTALNASFKSIIERHEILRTVFKEDEQGEINQWIKTSTEENFSISYFDLRKGKDQADQVTTLVQKDFLSSFDLATGPLLRAGLYRVGETKWIFSYVMHHIISDGWSMGILIKELLTLYNAYIKGESNPLVPLGIQYKDYALWQQAQLSGKNLQEHKSYWLERFSGDLPVLELSGDKIRPAVKTYNGGVVSRRINSRLSQGIKKLSQAEGGTLFMGLLAAVKTLLYRYSNQEDIIVGSPIAGREHSDLEDQIGFYINTIALRTRFKGEESYVDLLKKIKQVTLGAYEHQVYPFDELVDELGLARDMSRSALFDVMVVLQNADIGAKVREETQLGDIQVRAYQGGENQLSKFDLTFNFVERGEEIQASIEYNSDIYNKQTIESLGNHLEQLLNAIIEHPNASLKEIDYLSSEEKHKLVEEFNDTKVDYPKEKTIVDLFEEQAKKTPNNIALVFEETQLTYKELNERSNQLADYLRKNYKIKPDDLVGIKLERSEWMIISILGILKSGGAYVPIDPEYPQNRVDYMVEDSNCKVVIDNEELEKFKKVEKDYSKKNLKSINGPGDLAYVIYTSGTTGNPKGTLIEHKNVVRLFKTDKPLFDFNSTDVWTMFHSYCFDFSVWEMYGALLHGGKLIIVPSVTAKDPTSYIDLLSKEGVTILNQTPSSFYNIIKSALEKEEVDLQLHYVIFGGEALSPGKLEGWRKRYPATKLINMYGITETTVHVTYKEITEAEIEKNISNIGKPIPTLSCYVLDQHQNLLPIGVPGELYIGGAGVSRGYLNREDLTQQKFILNPFKEGEILYRSGDKAKLLENGEMEYLGRVDDQVKIRGYRIELGEIENALQQHTKIESAVVLAKIDDKGDKDLVAYVVSTEELNTTDLRDYLSSIIPSYMVPGHYVQLEKLPLTPNGKVDKKALPNSEGSEMQTGVEYLAPRNEIEKKLVGIWQEILGKEKIGVKDNFFELGGHSLKAVQLNSRINKEFNVNLGLNRLFSNPTINDIFNEIEKIYWANNELFEIDNNTNNTENFSI